MAAVKGTSGKDYIHVRGDGKHAPDGYADNDTATNFADTINIAKGGADIVFAGAGDDTIKAGAAFNAADQINGQGGNDTLILDGDYSAGVVFKAKTLTNVERIALVKGNSYSLTTHDAMTATTGMTFTIDGTALGKNNVMTIDGSAETNAILAIYAGAGNDVLTGGFYGNGYDLTKGGNDTATGTAAVDYFIMGGALNAKDKLSGGGGFGDKIFLDGDYHAGVVFNATTVVDVSTMALATGNDYNLTFNDATISTGRTMTVDGSLLGATNHLVLNAAAETNGFLTFLGGAGDDTLTGGQAGNSFSLDSGGNDTVKGGAGHDQFYFGAAYTEADHVDGAGGTTDLVILSRIGAQSLTLGAPSMKNISEVQINGGAYTITTQDSLVASGQTMSFKELFSTGTDVLNFNGAAETNGAFVIYGAGANDTITTGAGNDTLKGNGGQDTLTGGAGADIYLYSAASDSSGATYDKVVGFDFNADKFDLFGSVIAVDTAIKAGSLSTASFDTGLAQIFPASPSTNHLQSNHAVLFTPNHGTLSGHTFLVIESNGVQGYQVGADYVIEMVSAQHAANISIADFI